MEDEVFFRVAVSAGFAVAAGICWWMSNKDHTVPYGRHHLKAAAAISMPLTYVMLPTRLAWCVMESPPLLLTPFFFAVGQNASLTTSRTLAALFLTHYAHRCLLYPLLMRPSGIRNIPLLVFLSAVSFNVYNTYIQVRSLSHYTEYPSAWLASPQFILGAMLFISGMVINISADYMLISLRKSGPLASSEPTAGSSKAYRIPYGGLFELVSCPNYFGELVEWLGWAIAAWSVAGLVFFVLTVSNLVPRAVAHHRWYVRNFSEYPQSRKILVPLLF